MTVVDEIMTICEQFKRIGRRDDATEGYFNTRERDLVEMGYVLEGLRGESGVVV